MCLQPADSAAAAAAVVVAALGTDYGIWIRSGPERMRRVADDGSATRASRREEESNESENGGLRGAYYYYYYYCCCRYYRYYYYDVRGRMRRPSGERRRRRRRVREDEHRLPTSASISSRKCASFVPSVELFAHESGQREAMYAEVATSGVGGKRTIGLTHERQPLPLAGLLVASFHRELSS